MCPKVGSCGTRLAESMVSTGMAGDLADGNPARELAGIETVLILSLNVSMIGRYRNGFKGGIGEFAEIPS